MTRVVLIIMTMLFTGYVLAAPPSSESDKLSYAIGVKTGQAFKAHGVKVSPTTFAMGIRDVLQDKKLQMTEQQINATLVAFRKKSLAALKTQMQEVAAKNAQEGATFLAENKQKAGVKTTASGLQYRVIKAGSGKSPTLSDTVTVDYEGRLINGQVFDSSYRRGKPATFPLRGVIQGWQEALVMMKPGAVWMLYIPSNLAYGTQGGSGMIGQNETLIFKVDLISVDRH